MTDATVRKNSGPERMLVVEPDGVLRDVLSQDLTDLGYEVESVASATAAIHALMRSNFSVAFVDKRIARPGARVVLAAGRAWRPGLQYIVLVPFSDGLSDAMSMSPFACLRIPFSAEKLRSVTRLAARHAIVDPQIGELAIIPQARPALQTLTGRAEGMGLLMHQGEASREKA